MLLIICQFLVNYQAFGSTYYHFAVRYQFTIIFFDDAAFFVVWLDTLLECQWHKISKYDWPASRIYDFV